MALNALFDNDRTHNDEHAYKCTDFCHISPISGKQIPRLEYVCMVDVDLIEWRTSVAAQRATIKCKWSIYRWK